MENAHRIGIMTWYTYQNYGSALQASATYRTVKNLGYEPFFIQYPPKGGLTDTTKLHLTKRLLKKLKSLRSRNYDSAERSRLFNDYLSKRTTQSQLCVSYPELAGLNDTCSAFICGSDQIWSPICYDSKYFLPFVEDENKMIAYAPSMGSTEIADPVIRERIAAHISRFKHLSVREQQAADLIKSLTGQNAQVVLDPTLLMDGAQWDAYAEVDTVKEIEAPKYIICYFLGEADKYMGYVRHLAEEMNIPYYVIPVTTRQKNSENAVPFEVGPAEFVSLIRKAAYVCTDSFHGMAFSVNYGVPFSVFKRFKDNDPKNQNSRIFNLLKKLGLEARLVDYADKQHCQVPLTCDFTQAHRLLADERIRSLEYLKNALEAAVSSSGEDGAKPFKITDLCCGCGACASICGKGAITIAKNEEGFEHYTIDPDKCVGCKLCQAVCPMNRVAAPHMQDSQGLYAVKSGSDAVLRSSSSGGVGYELASHLLDEGYAVCGCMYDQTTNTAKHIWIYPGEKEKLSLIQGSKYIQSISAEALSQISDIAKTHKIAFFGTPCQVAGVDKLLCKKNLRDKAVLIDLICHGVPTQYLWDKYLSDIDKQYCTGLHPAVSFRNKELAWRERQIVIQGNGHQYKKVEEKDDFYAFFRRGLCDMPSCSDCPYREHSASDIRMGDYWGERFVEDKQGVSMVIANTLVGTQLIDTLGQKQHCKVDQYDLGEYWSVQYPYNQPRPLIREQLIGELKSDKVSMHALRKKYCTYYDKSERLSKVIRVVKKVLKRG